MALKNNLSRMYTYLVGAMDRVNDGGVEWRQKITPILKNMNINVLNPCSHQIKNIIEDRNTRNIIENYKETNQFDRIRDEYGHIRNADLRCVDISDFIIAQINMETHMCGSYEEIVTANRQKKPIILWCEQGKKNLPNWIFLMLPNEHIFESMSDAIMYLEYINNISDTSNLSRWIFFNR